MSDGTLIEEIGKSLSGAGVGRADILIRPLNGGMRLRNIICKANFLTLVNFFLNRPFKIILNGFFCSNKLIIKLLAMKDVIIIMQDFSRAWQTVCFATGTLQ